jgi:acyl carrier protein
LRGTTPSAHSNSTIAALDREGIRRRVHQVAAEQITRGHAEEVSDAAWLVRDLGADDLAIVEFVMGLEEEFGSAIPDADVEQLGKTTVGGVV